MSGSVELDSMADPETAAREEAVRAAEEAAEEQDARTDDGGGSRDTADGPARTEAADNNTPYGGETSAAAEPAAGNRSDSVDPDADASADPAATPADPGTTPPKRRRAPKLDPLLASNVDIARNAVLEVASEGQVGEHAGVLTEDDRVVTHLFESELPGYVGWQWFAVLTRVPRGKVATVSEVGILPSDRSLLAPEWVPWAKRISPEEKQREAEAEQAEAESKPQESQPADK